MLNPNEELKNLIIECPSNNNDLCERCKNAKVVLICSECSPFHNYCHNCDEIIHQLPSRINHNRKTISTNISSNDINSPIYLKHNNSSQNIILNNPNSIENYNNISLQNRTTYQMSNSRSAQNLLQESPDFKNKINNEEIPQYLNINPNLNEYNNMPQILGKSHQNSFYSGEILNNQSFNADLNNINNIDYIEIQQKNRDEDHKKTYTKEYILELQNIHQKEKNELLFKISSLENALDRIKSSFNDQIKKIQSNNNSKEKELTSKIEQIQENYDLKIKNLETEKDIQIALLKAQLSKEKETTNQIYSKLEKVKNDYKELQNNSMKNIDDINTELNLIKSEYDDFRRETDIIIEKLKSEYENKIQNIIQNNENQKTNDDLKHKMEIDTINTQINSQYKQIIDDLKNENTQLRQDNTILVQKISEIENDLEKVHMEYNTTANEYNNATNDLNVTINKKINENNELIGKIDELNKILEESKKENDKIFEQLHEKNDENNRLNQEMSILNNSLKNLKKNNDSLNERYNKLKKEYNNLSVQSDNLSLEYTNKIKSLNFIEDRNAMLERENNHLRNQLDKCVNPFSQ